LALASTRYGGLVQRRRDGINQVDGAALPIDLEELTALALDLRWTWSHTGDALWRRIDAKVWEQTRNP
jgi:uncharacterized protein DUF3417